MKIELSKVVQNFIPTPDHPTVAWLHVRYGQHFVGELTGIDVDSFSLVLHFDRVVMVEPNGEGKETIWRPVGKISKSNVRLEQLEISRCVQGELELYESVIGGSDRAILYTDVEKVLIAKKILDQYKQ